MRAKPSELRSMTLSEAILSQRTARVLIAEDDREMRTMLVRKLRRSGLDVVDAESGDAALSRIADGILHEPPLYFDLIIADIRMPGHSGLELLASIRRSDWSMPVILITGFGNPETHAEAKRLGAFAVFDKPFDLDDLRTAVLNATPAV